MANIFNKGTDNTAFLTKYHEVLDLFYIAESRTSILENRNYEFLGYNSVRIPEIFSQGLSDYNGSYIESSVEASHKIYTLNNDRGLEFKFDRIEAQDVLGPRFDIVKQAFKEAMRTKIIPEYDAKRIADLATAGASFGKEVVQDLDNTNTILAFDEAIQFYKELGIGVDNLICFLSPEVCKFLKQDSAGSTLSRRINLPAAGGINFSREVTSIDGISGIEVPSVRLYTKVTLNPTVAALTQANKRNATFTNPADARRINFIIVPKDGGIAAITRHQQLKTFSPDVNQNSDGWKVQFRTVYDTIIPENRASAIYVNRRASV